MSEFTPDIYKKPTIEQMFALNTIGVTLGREQDKLIKSRKADNAHVFLSNQIAEVCPGINDEESILRAATHKFTGRIAKVGYQRWSMRIAESHWVETRGISADDEDVLIEQDGYRSSYLFEWSGRGVTRAEKLMHVHRPIDAGTSRAFFTEGEDYNAQVDQLDMQSLLGVNERFYDPRLTGVLEMLGRVTQADVDLLIADVGAFRSEVCSVS